MSDWVKVVWTTKLSRDWISEHSEIVRREVVEQFINENLAGRPWFGTVRVEDYDGEVEPQ